MKESAQRRSTLLTSIGTGGAMLLMFDRSLRAKMGAIAGYVLDPLVGLHDQYPHLTILLLGAAVVVATTLVRHGTTNWLDHARKQRTLRAWQTHLQASRKDGNPRRLEALETHKDAMMALQGELTSHQMRTMPLTLLIVVPAFAWLATFMQSVDFPYYEAPWNSHVDLLGATVFPHWVLLYMCMSIPLGALASKSLKAWSWRRRPNTRPDVQNNTEKTECTA